MSTESQVRSWFQTLSEMGKRQREVMDLLIRVYPHGLGAWEVSDRLRRPVHAVRPRLTELKNEGIIREAGERFEPRMNRSEAIWIVTKPDGNGQTTLPL